MVLVLEKDSLILNNRINSLNQQTTPYNGSKFPYLDILSSVTHEVRYGARCDDCGVKGNNTYQMIWWGYSSVPMVGAEGNPKDAC